MANKQVNVNIVSKYDNKGTQNITKDLKNLQKKSKKTQEEVNNSLKSLATYGAKILTLGYSVVKATDFTDKYITSQKVLNNTFGGGTDSINQYISSISKMTGISDVSLSKQTSMFGQMSKSLGMSNDMAEKFSLSLDTLSAKLSLLYNIDFERASKALLDAAKGESSTLTTLTGIVIKTQSLQNTLDNLNINLKASELNGANLAMLQYITIANQVNATNEDLAQTVNDVAWQKKMLSEQVKNLSNALGNFFYPILRTILPPLNALLIVLTNIINILARLIGFSGEIGTSTSDVVDNLSDSIGGLASNTNKASKAALGLRNFDKLNNIKTPTSGSAAGGGGIGINKDLLNAFGAADKQLLNIKNKAQEIADQIMRWLGFTQDVNGEWKWSAGTLLKNIWTWWGKINGLGKILVGLGLLTLGKKLYDYLFKYPNILKRISKSNFWSLVSAFIEETRKAGLLTATKDLLDYLGPMGKFLGGIASALALFDGIHNIADGFSSMAREGANLNNVLQTLSGLLEAGGAIVAFIGLMMGPAGAPLVIGGAVSALAGFVGGLVTKTKDLNDEMLIAQENARKDVENKMLQATRAEELSLKLKDLVDENGRIKGSEEEVDFILQQLNDTLGTNYSVVGDHIVQNGDLKVTYDDISESVDEYMDKLRAQYTLEAYKDTYIEALKNHNKAQQEINANTEYYEDELKKLKDKYAEGEITFQEYQYEEKKLMDARDKALDDINKKYGESEKVIENFENLQKAIISGNMEDIQKYTNELLGGTEEYVGKTATEINRGLDNIINKISKTKGEWKSTIDYMNKNSTIRTPSVIPIQGRAEGGFVDSGEVFVSRENGMPEMVGRFGNKTGVANNDQIVDSIKGGVKEAMYDVMSAFKVGNSNNQPIYNKFVVGDDEMTDWILQKNKKLDRQYGL